MTPTSHWYFLNFCNDVLGWMIFRILGFITCLKWLGDRAQLLSSKLLGQIDRNQTRMDALERGEL